MKKIKRKHNQSFKKFLRNEIKDFENIWDIHLNIKSEKLPLEKRFCKMYHTFRMMIHMAKENLKAIQKLRNQSE